MQIPRGRVFLFTVLAVLPLILSSITTSPANAQGAGETSFVFAASGDLNSPIKGVGSDSLRSLKSLNPNFFLGLGDLSYDSSYTGTQWCGAFKAQFSNIEIIPGYHDTGDDANLSDTSATRSYEKFVGSHGSTYGCPYSLATVPSCERKGCDYGREYYFDYPCNPPNVIIIGVCTAPDNTPANDPIARFIMISPQIYNITGRCGQSGVLKFPDCNSPQQRKCNYLFDCWNYERDDLNDIDYHTNSTVNHWNWLKNAIEGAQSQNEWVIVGIHKLCISAGRESCEIGTQLFNFLLAEKVDLILEGDDHAYERSKQLALNNSTLVNGLPLCDGIATNKDSWAVYNSTTSGCIIDDGSRGFYQPGAGTVVVIDGTFSCNFNNPCYNVNDTSINNGYNAAEAPYFVKLMGGNTPGNGNGFVSYTVTGKKGNDGRIDVQTHFAGSFQDFFSISKPPVSTVTWSPPNPGPGYAVAFSTVTAGGIPPYSYSWSFGDGSTATGSTPVHSYQLNGYYNVTLTTMDSLGNSRTAQQFMVVGSWNPAVSCSPTLSTLEGVLGSVTIQRISSDSNSTGADYSGGAFKLAGNLPYGANPSASEWPFSKRALHPYSGGKPCSTSGVPAFVEVHSVTALSVDPQEDCGIYKDISNAGGLFRPDGSTFCSTTFNLASSKSSCPACYMYRIYAVIDRDWKAAGIAPASPAQGQTIDVQGFVYWNSQWVDQPWHSYTGWELHVTAWRISTTPITTPVSFFSGNGLWYVLGALGTTVVLVLTYETRLPPRIKAFIARSRLRRSSASEKRT